MRKGSGEAWDGWGSICIDRDPNQERAWRAAIKVAESVPIEEVDLMLEALGLPRDRQSYGTQEKTTA